MATHGTSGSYWRGIMIRRMWALVVGIARTRRRRQRERGRFLSRLPNVEWLEGRQLLAVVSGGTSEELVVDSSVAATSLIVQFRDGTTNASSLAAYVTGADLGEEW